jgi:hypothetical protein
MIKKTMNTEVDLRMIFPDIDYSQVLKTINFYDWKVPKREVRPSKFFFEFLERINKVVIKKKNKDVVTSIMILEQIYIDVILELKNNLNPKSSITLYQAVAPWGKKCMWTLFYNMVLLQEKTKKNIYGISTDSRFYIFYKLDGNSKIIRSRILDFCTDKEQIWNFISIMAESSEQFLSIEKMYV